MTGRAASSAEPGFGVYIHWPFCAQKCPYCDFNSHVRHGGWDEARFLAAYERELSHVVALTGRRRVGSIFFGGGTPSLMQPTTVARLIEAVARLWSLDADAEITLEANPGSVEAGRFAGYRDAGVNRVSVGVQSLDDAALKRLGRIHSAAEARAALGIARNTFERVSFDLIYARPGQSPDEWGAELAEALALAEAGHLSLYQLTIEPGTRYADLFAAGKLVVPDGEAAHALFDVTQEQTEAAGLAAYEISNHARPGEESRHNLVYWRYGEYAGVGPGAHGRIVSGGQRLATATERHPETWLAATEAQGHGIVETTEIGRAEAADELLLMALRLAEGVDLDRLAAVGAVTPSRAAIDRLAGDGLLVRLDAAGTGCSPAPADALDDDDGPEVIRACLGPGLAPSARRAGQLGRIAATRRGRFVLNELVLQLARSLEPA